MEGIVIFTVVLMAIVAGIYSVVDAWNSSVCLNDSDKSDLD